MAFLVVGGPGAAGIRWDLEEDLTRHVSEKHSLPEANGPRDPGAVEAHIDATAPRDFSTISEEGSTEDSAFVARDRRVSGSVHDPQGGISKRSHGRHDGPWETPLVARG